MTCTLLVFGLDKKHGALFFISLFFFNSVTIYPDLDRSVKLALVLLQRKTVKLAATVKTVKLAAILQHQRLGRTVSSRIEITGYSRNAISDLWLTRVSTITHSR